MGPQDTAPRCDGPLPESGRIDTHPLLRPPRRSLATGESPLQATRLFLLAFALMLVACTGLSGGSRREGVSSSLVDYLYPDGEKPPRQSRQIPQLQLPLSIGIAFVPSQPGSSQALSEEERMKVLYDVKTIFSGRNFIEEIAVIPAAYLRVGRGFGTVEQTAQQYGVDVMALVSYDQVANDSEEVPTLVYWTIAGAQTVTGNKNDVHTFVDTAVFDITTRTLLFRASGAGVTELKGFEQAMAGMTLNLTQELERLEERIRADGSVKFTRGEVFGPQSPAS
jgi:hypothetical protein